MKKSKINEYVKSPRKSLILISLPVIAAAIVETLYNIVDGIFVGRLGSDALAAISFCWPFYFILVALSLGINSGVSSKISRLLGAKKKLEAENIAMHGMLIAMLISLLVIIFGIPFNKYLLGATGASGIVLEMASIYMLIIYIGSIFLFLSFTVTSIFIAQGDTKTAMKIDIYSLILNIILAPILIFTFKLGIAGAGLATSLSLMFAFFQSLYFLNKNSYLKLEAKCFKFSFENIKEIISVGIPATLTMLIFSFYVIFLNKAMAHFSFDHVAAFGIASRLESVVILPIYGLSVGAMTLVGIFYGAKKYDLLKKITWFAIKICFLVTGVIGIIFFIFPKIFLMIFISDPKVLGIGIPYLRLDVFTFPAMAITMVFGRIMQSMGKGLPGLVISIVRILVLAVPLSYFFVFVLGWGYLSIAVAMVIGGAISTIISLIWLKKSLDKKCCAKN